MNPLNGKVMMPDGENKMFSYADVEGAVNHLKQLVNSYCKHKLISQTSRDINGLIDEAFHDVIVNSYLEGY